jgi:hypothetical protein
MRSPSARREQLEVIAEILRLKIKKLEDAYFERVYTIAETARQEVVIPFCNKHQIAFRAGNGTCAFCTPDGGLLEYQEYDRALHEYPGGRNRVRGAKTVMATINMNVPCYTDTMPKGFPGSGGLGSLMDDYTPAGLKTT